MMNLVEKLTLRSLLVIMEEYCSLSSHVQGSLWLLEGKLKVKEAERMEGMENILSPYIIPLVQHEINF